MLVTGGSGLLGSEIKKLIPNALYPTSKKLNVNDLEGLVWYIDRYNIDLVLHLAAFTSPPRVEEKPQIALNTNIIGTSNVVYACMFYDIKLIYISTDYVFRGDRGDYKEEDELYPINKYAWSKLGGECAVRMYDNSLIIRVAFGENTFPYEKAFIDQYTSRMPVSKMAEKIVYLLDKDIKGVIHIGGERKTVYEYAKSLDGTKEIGKLKREDVSFPVPYDTSLDNSKYNKLWKDIKER